MNLQKKREAGARLENLEYAYQKTFRTIGETGNVESLEALDASFGSAGPFRNMRLVDLHARAETSLQAAAYYDEACEKLGEACKVVIADYEGDYYAWVEYFKGGEWKRGSLYEGVPAYAKVVYEEPVSRLVALPQEGERDKVYYDATSFLLDINKSEALMYFALIIVAALVIIIVIHFKAKSIMRADRKVSANVRIDPNGEYDVTGDARFDDPMLDELMRIIKARKGVVDVASIEAETRYSKELVGFGVQYLGEQGLIRKRNAPYQAPQSARLLAKEREGFDAFIGRIAKGKVKGPAQPKKPKKG